MPGGFLDRDETTSVAILREIREETGYSAKIISLFRIVDKPDRLGEDRQNVTFIFLVRALKKKGEHDHEVTQAEWFKIDNLPKSTEFAFDHYEHIELYRKYLKKKFPLPLIGGN